MHEILVKINDLFQSLGVPGLALNSFIESFFLVPPPDILLISMDLAKPEKSLYYATICTSEGVRFLIFFSEINTNSSTTLKNFMNNTGLWQYFFPLLRQSHTKSSQSQAEF